MERTNPTIRRYQADDRQQVLGLFRANVPEFFAPAEEADLERYLADLPGPYFVLEQGQGPVIGSGGCELEPDGLTGRISWDFLHPDYHRRGLGSRLLRHRLSWLQQEGAVRIVVRTSQLAWQFYARHGFRLLETRTGYWAPGYDLYAMEWKAENP